MTDVLDATDNFPLSHCHAHVVPHLQLQLTIDPDSDVDAMLALTSSNRSICSPHIHPEIISPVSLSLSSTGSDWMMHDESTESDQESPYRYRITSTHTRSPSDAEMVIIHPEEEADMETPRTRNTSLLSTTSFLFDPAHVNVGSTPFASPMSCGMKLLSAPPESTPLPTPIGTPLSSPLSAHKPKELHHDSPATDKDTSPTTEKDTPPSPEPEKETSPRDAVEHAESQQEKDTQLHGASQPQPESPTEASSTAASTETSIETSPSPSTSTSTSQSAPPPGSSCQPQTQPIQEEQSPTHTVSVTNANTNTVTHTDTSMTSATNTDTITNTDTDTDTRPTPSPLDCDSRPHILCLDSLQSDIIQIDSTTTLIDMTATSPDESSPSESAASSSSSSPSDSDSESDSDDPIVRVCDPPTPLESITCHSSLPLPDSPTDSSPTAPPEQTVTLVDKDELRTQEDAKRSLQLRKQKMSRNPKRQDYMHRAAHQLLVHNATWNNETFAKVMNPSNTDSPSTTPRPRSKSISFFNQARLRYYRHEEETHRMYHRPTASTECSSVSLQDILNNKPKQGILKRTTYVGPIHLPSDEEDTPRSPCSSSSSSSSSSCSSSNNSSRRPSISKSRSYPPAIPPQTPTLGWNDARDLSEMDAEELIRQEEAEMERLEQMESARRSHSARRHDEAKPLSMRPSLSLRPPLTISTSPTTSPTSQPMSSPFLISPPSSGGTVSPSSTYSSIFSSNPSLTLDSPSNIISSSHLDIVNDPELITSSQLVGDSDSEDEGEVHRGSR